MAQRESGVLCYASNRTGEFITYFTWDDVTNEIVRFRWDNTSQQVGHLTLASDATGEVAVYDFAPGTAQSVNTRGSGYFHAEIQRFGTTRHYVAGHSVACGLDSG